MGKDNLALIKPIIEKYAAAFSQKEYSSENNESDILMDIFSISPEIKRENRQYWGRELGMLWQLIITNIVKNNCGSRYQGPLRINDDEPCDLIIDNDAIDTKYRVGSGDSGTLKKFKSYGQLLKQKGFNPVFLMLRTDNLPAAITAAKKGGWTIYEGEESFEYIKMKTGVSLKELLATLKGMYPIA